MRGTNRLSPKPLDRDQFRGLAVYVLNRHRRLVAAAAVAAALLVGCGDNDEDGRVCAVSLESGCERDTGEPVDPSGDSPVPEPEPPADSPGPSGDAVDYATKVLTDANALRPILDRFWTDELETLYGLEFDPPDRFEVYRGTGNSACGTSDEPLPNNAYYCVTDGDEHVAFDLNWFMSYLPAHPGGATTFLILAHEWGHAVQDTWLEQGGTDVWDPPYRQELNADCLAGVFLQRGLEEGTILEESGDADAVFSWLWEAGSGPWFEPGDHGTKEQRQTAFAEGFTEGTHHCRTEY